MPRITLNIFDVTPFRAFVLATMLSFMAFTPVAAQDLQKDLDAYLAGDFKTSIELGSCTAPQLSLSRENCG